MSNESYSKRHNTTVPSIPPDTIKPTLGFVSIVNIDPSCANILLTILSCSHKYNYIHNDMKTDNYISIISTGYECVL